MLKSSHLSPRKSKQPIHREDRIQIYLYDLALNLKIQIILSKQKKPKAGSELHQSGEKVRINSLDLRYRSSNQNRENLVSTLTKLVKPPHKTGQHSTHNTEGLTKHHHQNPSYKLQKLRLKPKTKRKRVEWSRKGR